MKRIAAILLLIIFAFNIGGYRWLFSYLEQKATARIDQQIDNGNFSEAQLMEVQIPLNMPYYADKDYESVYGEMQWNGEHYRYVKRKIVNNVLYLLCLPHEEKNKLQAAKDDFAKTATDIPLNNSPKQEAPSYIKLLMSEFLPDEKIAIEKISVSVTKANWLFNTKVKTLFDPLSPFQPPEA